MSKDPHSGLRATLQREGFVLTQCEANDVGLAEQVRDIASSLGRILKGRHSEIEALVPRGPTDAPPRSLSAIYGKEAFPWHIDTAHLTVPARYIVMACAQTALDCAPTYLAKWQFAIPDLFSNVDAREALFRVRNGRESFFAEFLDRDSRFLRHDPGCMTPANMKGRIVQDLLLNWEPSEMVVVRWRPGTIAVIDNWASYNDFWVNDCPSCSAAAIVAGDQTYEDLSEDQDEAEDGYETVEKGFAAEELFCPTCELHLQGEDALRAADIDLEHTTYESREIEYEPDYGND